MQGDDVPYLFSLREYDLHRQVSIAKTQKHLETVSQRVAEIGKYASEARLR